MRRGERHRARSAGPAAREQNVRLRHLIPTRKLDLARPSAVQFDGVPGVSFPGIKPGETSPTSSRCARMAPIGGTRTPARAGGVRRSSSVDPDPRYDRDYVVLLSEFTPIPHEIMRKLKQSDHALSGDDADKDRGRYVGRARLWANG